MNNKITLQGFKEFLLTRLSQNSASSYVSNLKRVHNDIINSIPPKENLLSVICDECNKVTTLIEKQEIVQKYIYELTNLLSVSYSLDGRLKKNVRDARAALRSFLLYVNSVPDSKSKTSVQIDGMSSVTDLFPSLEVFVKYVVSNCYFFSEDEMKKRFDLLAKAIEDDCSIPARRTTNGSLYNKKEIKRGEKDLRFVPNGLNILTHIDGNGNAEIDKILRGAGWYLKKQKNREADLINFKISHIWGNAFDPRYFSNLWNIVLVPSFANDILDKPSSNIGSYQLGSLLLNTIKAIISKYYQFDQLPWQAVKLMMAPVVGVDFVKGTHSINIIGEFPNVTQVDVEI